MKKLSCLQLATSGLFILLVNLQVSAHSHNHDHDHDSPVLSEKAYQASIGNFDNIDVKDRALSDWEGTWQSVEPYFLNGDLDIVIQSKVEKNPNKSFDEYKKYYARGYATDIEFIGIESNQIDFHKKDSEASCAYQYSGHKILTYSSGKKGVRYLFTCNEKNTHAPKYIQFSDHIIEPTKPAHFHIYMGNESHEKLLEEMDNWPTYYPLSLNKDDIVHEMLHH